MLGEQLAGAIKFGEKFMKQKEKKVKANYSKILKAKRKIRL